jgi:peptide/nickel transport system substrate-binding protein
VDAGKLLSAEVAHRKPLGWGPFVVEEWLSGERITLVRNARYFRAAEGLPYLDRVTFRFVPDLSQALDLLLAGECDLINQDLIESGDVTRLVDAAAAGTVQLISSPSSVWMHLDFGIAPADWAPRPNFFGDVRTRQALARCIDRARIANAVLSGWGSPTAAVAHSYVAPEHPLYAAGQLYQWDYDPLAGQALLAEIGWRDENGDGVREAYGVQGVAQGTPFSVKLLTTDDYPIHGQTASALVDDLSACGVGVTVEVLPPEEFFADGPDGWVFGRQFDLALFSWLNGLEAPCELYLSDQIPGPENWWAASNNPGYVSADYDAACRAARAALPGVDEYTYFHHQAQRIFSYDLPVLPLYFVPQVVAARPGVSGVTLDPGQYLPLWNIEAFAVAQ